MRKRLETAFRIKALQSLLKDVAIRRASDAARALEALNREQRGLMETMDSSTIVNASLTGALYARLRSVDLLLSAADQKRADLANVALAQSARAQACDSLATKLLIRSREHRERTLLAEIVEGVLQSSAPASNKRPRGR